MKSVEEKVYEIIRNNHIMADVYESLGMIVIEISWGDWKHDHLRAQWIMKENGFKQLFEEVTEDDGSDTYSAIHYFVEVNAGNIMHKKSDGQNYIMS